MLLSLLQGLVALYYMFGTLHGVQRERGKKLGTWDKRAQEAQDAVRRKGMGSKMPTSRGGTTTHYQCRATRKAQMVGRERERERERTLKRKGGGEVEEKQQGEKGEEKK